MLGADVQPFSRTSYEELALLQIGDMGTGRRSPTWSASPAR